MSAREFGEKSLKDRIMINKAEPDGIITCRDKHIVMLLLNVRVDVL